MVWGGRREEGSGWGTHVYLWWIHFDIWQNQYNSVKFKNKIKLKKKRIYSNQKTKRNKSKKSPLPIFRVSKSYLTVPNINIIGVSEVGLLKTHTHTHLNRRRKNSTKCNINL